MGSGQEHRNGRNEKAQRETGSGSRYEDGTEIN